MIFLLRTIPQSPSVTAPFTQGSLLCSFFLSSHLWEQAPPLPCLYFAMVSFAMFSFAMFSFAMFSFAYFSFLKEK